MRSKLMTESHEPLAYKTARIVCGRKGTGQNQWRNVLRNQRRIWKLWTHQVTSPQTFATMSLMSLITISIYSIFANGIKKHELIYILQYGRFRFDTIWHITIKLFFNNGFNTIFQCLLNFLESNNKIFMKIIKLEMDKSWIKFL